MISAKDLLIKPKFRIHHPMMKLYNNNYSYYKGNVWEPLNTTALICQSVYEYEYFVKK